MTCCFGSDGHYRRGDEDVNTDSMAIHRRRAADQAVLRLQQLGFQRAIELHDVVVIRWPEYAAEELTTGVSACALSSSGMASAHRCLAGP